MVVRYKDKKCIKLLNRSKLSGSDYTIQDFMDRERILFMEPKDLFDFNREYIFEQMGDKFKKRLKFKYGKYPKSSSDLKVEWILPSPCYINIPVEKVTMETAINASNFQTLENDFSLFAAESIKGLIKDEGYVKADGYEKRADEPFVFIWSKATRRFYDISRFIVGLDTSVTVNGGNFSIELPYIVPAGNLTFRNREVDESGEIIQGSKTRIEKIPPIVYNHPMGYYHKSNLSKLNIDWFSAIFSSNDLVFIAFEQLELEDREALKNVFKDGESGIFDGVEDFPLSNGVFDMIGLIDTIAVSHSSNSASVNISGRDLMKLLIDDGSFFYTYSSQATASDVFDNKEAAASGDKRSVTYKDGEIKPIDRIRMMSGNVLPFENVISKDIGYIATVVMSILANIEIAPSNLFDSYGNSRTRIVDFKYKNTKK